QRHTNVEQDHGEVLTQQVSQGILARLRFDDKPVRSIKQRLHRLQRDRIIINDQDAYWNQHILVRDDGRLIGLTIPWEITWVRWLGFSHLHRVIAFFFPKSQMRNSASNSSVLTGFAI